jgi:hypothetical protein
MMALQQSVPRGVHRHNKGHVQMIWHLSVPLADLSVTLFDSGRRRA